MRRLVGALMMWMAPVSAQAWNHSGVVVPPEERPIRWSMDSSDVPRLTAEQLAADVKLAFDNWEAAHCGVKFEFLGVQSYDDLTEVPADQLHLTFEPLGTNAPSFVPLGPDPAVYKVFERDGTDYLRQGMRPWVVNTDVHFQSNDAIESGDCFQRYSMTTMTGFFLGTQLGLAPAYNPGGLMHTSIATCAVVQPNDDDIDGVDVLYGPHVQITCSNDDDPSGGVAEVNGSVPFEVQCEVTGDGASVPTDAQWSFGDGKEVSGVNVSHQLTQADNVKLWASVDGTHDSCGTFTRRVERFNYIRACARPDPDFDLELYNNLTFKILNRSDVSVFGCHRNVRWRAFDADGEQVYESFVWEPQITFPQDGEYRVELFLQGMAGDATSDLVIDTTEVPTRPFTMGNGCDSTALGGGVAGVLGLMLLGGRRRRDPGCER